MTEYIERAAILQAIEESEPDVMADYGEYYGSEWGFSRSKLSEIIRGMPAADVVEVRHGRWYLAEDAVFRCSECGRICYELDAPYCYCGALMREVGNGEK